MLGFVKSQIWALIDIMQGFNIGSALGLSSDFSLWSLFFGLSCSNILLFIFFRSVFGVSVDSLNDND